MPRPSHSSLFDHSNNIGRRVQIIKLLVLWFSPIPCYLDPLRPKHSPRHPILKLSQPTFLLQCERPSFTPIQKKRHVKASFNVRMWPRAIRARINTILTSGQSHIEITGLHGGGGGKSWLRHCLVWQVPGVHSPASLFRTRAFYLEDGNNFPRNCTVPQPAR
jgi:hypothetical protein